MFLGFNWVIIVFVHFFQVGKSLSASGYPIFLGMPNVRLHSYVAGRERSGRISVCWTFCHSCFNLTPGSPRLHQSASSLCHARLSGRTLSVSPATCQLVCLSPVFQLLCFHQCLVCFCTIVT